MNNNHSCLDNTSLEHENPITIRIFTIGYAGKNARQFFTILKQAGIGKVIDVRLYNTSQLAGFTKRQDTVAGNLRRMADVCSHMSFCEIKTVLGKTHST